MNTLTRPLKRCQAFDNAHPVPSLKQRRNWLIVPVLVMIVMLGVGGWMRAGADAPDPDHEVDREHFRQIWSAIQAYRNDHDGRLPDWLSDLFPKYLTDPDVLLCPAAERVGRAQLFGNDDPHMRTSYIYEFNALPASDFHVADPTVRATMKDWKTKQMEAFGEAVPVVRCLNHPRVLNLAMSGDIYETALFWETDPNTLALMKQLGVHAPDTEIGPGLEIEVVDRVTGQGIAGARVSVLLRGPTGYQPARDWTSDAGGLCRVTLPEGTIRELRLEVAHADYVTVSMVLQEEAGLDLPKSQQIALEPGIVVGGRVEDPDGNPIAGVEVSVAHRHLPQFDAVGIHQARTVTPTATTDERGHWRMGGVPSSIDRAFVGFSHPQFRRMQSVIAMREDTTDRGFTLNALTDRTALMVLQPRVEVRIEAVAEETALPIEEFRVLLAYPSRFGLAWDTHRHLHTRDGQVVLRLQQEHDRLPTLLRVQAPGYQPAIHSQLCDKAVDQMIRTRLRPTRVVEGRVLDSTGRGVPDVSIGWVSELGSLRMGIDGLEAGPGTELVQSGVNGTFRLAEMPDAVGVVAWHPTGHAEKAYAAFLQDPELVLSEWGRVEGLLPPGAHGEPTVALLAASEHLPRLFPGTVPGLLQYEPEACMAQADADGRFLLERAPAGQRLLWHPVLVRPEYPPFEGFFSFNGRWLDVKAGQTTRVEVSRRSVRGQLQVPDGPRSSATDMDLLLMERYGLPVRPEASPIRWSQALAWVRFDPVTDSGNQPLEALVTFSHDGQFRLEGVPTGRHRIQMRVFQPPQLVGTAELEVEIPEAETSVLLGESGVIQLAEVKPRGVGERLPDRLGEDFSGRQISLSELRGQPVWLHFWTSWSGAGQGSFPALESLLEEWDDAGSTRLVSVNLDVDLSLAHRLLENRNLPGLHTHDGGWLTSSLAEVCGVQSLPWLVRIGSDGRVQSTGPVHDD